MKGRSVGAGGAAGPGCPPPIGGQQIGDEGAPCPEYNKNIGAPASCKMSLAPRATLASFRGESFGRSHINSVALTQSKASPEMKWDNVVE